MTLHGQTIHGPESQTVSALQYTSREMAVFQAVSMAIEAGWHPPRWWEFWLPRWPEDCRAEYERRVA